MNNCSNNNITVDTVEVNTPAESTPVQVCPFVLGKNGKPLNGSIKRNAMETNRSYVESVHELMGFEYACEHFKCKAGTMLEFLNRGGRRTRKAITPTEVNSNRIIAINEKVYEIQKELDRKDVTITELLHRGYQLTDIMKAWHEKQADMHKQMVGFLEAITPDLTYHIYPENVGEVSPTCNDLTLSDTKRIKAGPTSNREMDRLSVSKKKAGKSLPSRPRKTRGTLRERYENSKRRYRRV